MRKIFVNHTNHPSARWSAEQISAAQVYGEILDMPFPAVREFRKNFGDETGSRAVSGRIQLYVCND